MRILLLAVTFLALLSPATAQNFTLEGVVRTASLYAAIAEFCPQHHLVDVRLATRTAKTMSEVAQEGPGCRNDSAAGRTRATVRRGQDHRIVAVVRLPATEGSKSPRVPEAEVIRSNQKPAG
jgi:hypothetical protein